MFTIKFTKTQAERYIASRLEFTDRYGDVPVIPTDNHTLIQLSDMDYAFRKDDDYLDQDMAPMSGKAPFVAYMPKHEAEHICAQHSMLVGKTELITGHTIVQMKATRCFDMALSENYPKPGHSDWGVYAKVNQKIETLNGPMEFSKWILFDNTAQFNAGIPTVGNLAFNDMAQQNLWSFLQNSCTLHDKDNSQTKYLGTNRYLPLPYTFLIYHTIPKFVYSYYDNIIVDVKLSYAEKSGLEPYNKWDCLSAHTFCNIYADVNVNWGDDQYSFDIKRRATLFDYLNDKENYCLEDIKANLRWAPLI